MIRLAVNNPRQILYSQNFVHNETTGFTSESFNFDHNIPVDKQIFMYITTALSDGTVIHINYTPTVDAGTAYGAYQRPRVAGNPFRASATLYRFSYGQSSYSCTAFFEG